MTVPAIAARLLQSAASTCTESQVSQQIGADEGARTLDLRFTKPLLYQLSYVGGGEGQVYPAR